MPWFINGLDKKYEHTAAVMRKLPKLRTRSPRVFKAYLKHTGLSAVQGQTSLYTAGVVMVGDGSFAMQAIPQVELTTDISGYAHYYGDKIQLRKTFVEQYEALMKVDEMTGRDPRGLYYEERLEAKSVSWHQKWARLLMQSKILHEMVHWARSMVTFLPDPQGYTADEGWKFEKTAYGKRMTYTSLGLSYYLNLPGTK